MTIHTDPLSRLRPLSEDQLRSAADRHSPTTATAPLAYDVYRVGNELVIAFDAPGATADHVELDIDGPWVTVKIERALPHGHGIDVVQVGRPHGAFSQRLFMGDGWDLSRAQATVRDGVLEIHAPVATAATRRRILIDNGATEPSTEHAPSLDVHVTDHDDEREREFSAA